LTEPAIQLGFAERGDCRIQYAVSGRNHAPALLLLNPLGANLDVWSEQRAALERVFRVIRFDARGHGGSALPKGEPSPCSIDDLLGDALAVLDALRVPRAHWCGLSLGGMIAMRAAVASPERVGRLVLANTTAHLPPASMWDERIATVLRAGMGPIADALPQRWFTPGFVERAPAAVERVVVMVRSTQPRGYAQACAAIRDMDQRSTLGDIVAPTLVLAGARDPSTPVEHAEALLDGIRGSDLRVLDAAHLSCVEDAEEFTGAVLDFVRD
jgi:3-oxoadipate enol-lactonase